MLWHIFFTLCLLTAGAGAAGLGDRNLLQAAGGLEAIADDDYVAIHNYYRAQYGASPLREDPAAAAAAESYGSQCQLGQHENAGTYGENLYWEYPTGSYKRGLASWMSEEPRYDYAFAAQNGYPSDYSTGHFSQVIWKGSTGVGCALVQCPNPGGAPWQYYSCYYSPPGNVYSQYAENVGEPGTTAAPVADPGGNSEVGDPEEVTEEEVTTGVEDPDSNPETPLAASAPL